MLPAAAGNTVRVNRAKMESLIFSPWGTEGKVEEFGFARRRSPLAE